MHGNAFGGVLDEVAILVLNGYIKSSQSFYILDELFSRTEVS